MRCFEPVTVPAAPRNCMYAKPASRTNTSTYHGDSETRRTPTLSFRAKRGTCCSPPPHLLIPSNARTRCPANTTQSLSFRAKRGTCCSPTDSRSHTRREIKLNFSVSPCLGGEVLVLWCSYLERVVRHIALGHAAVVDHNFLRCAGRSHANRCLAFRADFKALHNLSAREFDDNGNFGPRRAEVVDRNRQHIRIRHCLACESRLHFKVR